MNLYFEFLDRLARSFIGDSAGVTHTFAISSLEGDQMLMGAGFHPRDLCGEPASARLNDQFVCGRVSPNESSVWLCFRAPRQADLVVAIIDQFNGRLCNRSSFHIGDSAVKRRFRR